METQTLAVDARSIGKFEATPNGNDFLDELRIELDLETIDARHLQKAAQQLQSSDIPVAFPTETVYGLGADATRSAAVQGIYKAKQRPSDNPLIVHFASLGQLRSLLRGNRTSIHSNGVHDEDEFPEDPIPAIYKPLISRFWPGPMTIILPNPENSSLAPEVTAGLTTFGARMPRHVLALALIQLAGVPIAAPSANASTKPSPTAAEHVAYDLDGRIETIIDGGPCDVGVESTVVDGLSSPPVILRPGGLSLEQIRTCPGWEDTQIAYKNQAEAAGQPRAPGMKYRHYSPKAVVILYEACRNPPTTAELLGRVGTRARIGLVRTKSWTIDKTTSTISAYRAKPDGDAVNGHDSLASSKMKGFAGMLLDDQASNRAKAAIERHQLKQEGAAVEILDINLGHNTDDIARGLFSALRDLDRHDVDAIFVEGIDDEEGDTAAAIMNRLRKAAEVRLEG